MDDSFEIKSRRFAEVSAHTSFINIHVITTFVCPYTAPAGQALGCNEGTSFNNKSQHQKAGFRLKSATGMTVISTKM